MSLDRSVTINLGGKERKIKFNALGVSQLERMLDDHNVYKMVNGGVIALGDLAKSLYVGLAAYDKKVTIQQVSLLLSSSHSSIQQVYNWMDEWLLDNSSESLQTLVIIALSKAGVFGFARKVLETENNTLEIEVPPDDEEVGK